MAHPPFDAELEPALAVLSQHLPASLTPELVPELRAVSEQLTISDTALRRDGLIDIEERLIPGPAGAEISLLVCRAAGVTATRPGVVYLHAGGMMVGNNRTGIETALDWVLDPGAVVVSVEYRLAPEHPYPAQIEDCYAAACWTVENAALLGIDPARVLLTGASAGGGLAAAVALMARDRSGPSFVGQLLMSPMLDDHCGTPSSHELHGEGVWDRTSNLTAWEALLGEGVRGGPDVPTYAAPARAADLAGLPPAYIDCGSVEILRDEDVHYAVRIWRAGGAAELHVWSGGFHMFDSLAPEAKLSAVARKTRTAWVRRTLAG
jgi:acetyl esterase/lipase